MCCLNWQSCVWLHTLSSSHTHNGTTHFQNVNLCWGNRRSNVLQHTKPHRFQFLERARDFSVLESNHNSSGTHPTSHSRCTRSIFPRKWCMTQTAHPHPLSTLIISGIKHPLTPHTPSHPERDHFMPWPLTFTYICLTEIFDSTALARTRTLGRSSSTTRYKQHDMLPHHHA